MCEKLSSMQIASKTTVAFSVVCVATEMLASVCSSNLAIKP